MHSLADAFANGNALVAALAAVGFLTVAVFIRLIFKVLKLVVAALVFGAIVYGLLNHNGNEQQGSLTQFFNKSFQQQMVP